MLASDPFYMSGLFWGVVGAVISLAALVVTVVIWRFGAPQRQLNYSMPVSTSLLTTHSRDFGLETSGLAVTYKGQALRDPYVVTLRVDSRSRRDISSADFDQKRPIVFDVGAPIRAILRGHGPLESPSDVVSISGNTVKIDPTLIHRGPVLQLNLLIDGPPRLRCQNHLIDVKVTEQSPEEAQKRTYHIRALSLTTTAFIIPLAVGSSALSIYYFSHLGGPTAITYPVGGVEVSRSHGFITVGTTERVLGSYTIWVLNYRTKYNVAARATTYHGKWYAMDKPLGGPSDLLPHPLTVVAVKADTHCASQLAELSQTENSFAQLPPGCIKVDQVTVTVSRP